MKVLVVEDSARLRRALTEGFRRSGFVFDVAEDGEAGARYARAFDYDVIVLDIMLPKVDGLTLLRQLRDDDNGAQVLILSARDGVEDRVRGLELGADDYLVKPFAFEELIARIKALVRRRHEVTRSSIVIGRVAIDTARRLALSDHAEVPLTPAEYNLLEHLVLRRGRVVSKSQLKYWLSDSNSEASSNVVEVLVSNIRRKIGVRNGGVIIRTKRGFGYYVE
jgi:DNA-binding response OmpR family regulator